MEFQQSEPKILKTNDPLIKLKIALFKKMIMDIGYSDIDKSIKLLEDNVDFFQRSNKDKIELSIIDAQKILDILKDYMDYLTT